jgi:hypothetical protein
VGRPLHHVYELSRVDQPAARGKRAELDEGQKLLPESQRVSLAEQKRAVLAALA